MERVLWVAAGGALGSVLRYLVSLAALRRLGEGFPWGTLAVNVVGSFLLGLVLGGWPRAPALAPHVRLGLTAGALGGFTTFSAFSYETARLVHQGALGAAALNVVLNVALGLAACFAGLTAARAAG